MGEAREGQRQLLLHRCNQRRRHRVGEAREVGVEKVARAERREEMKPGFGRLREFQKEDNVGRRRQPRRRIKIQIFLLQFQTNRIPI